MTVIQNSNVVSFWRQTDTSQNKLYYVAYVLHDRCIFLMQNFLTASFHKIGESHEVSLGFC